MEILEINYVNFRNLNNGNVKFFPDLNLFFGKNGQGKTSLLEAIYFGSAGQSFRTRKIQDMVKYEQNKMGIYILFKDNISEKSLTVKFTDGKKEFFYNNKKVSQDEFYGRLNIVTYIPEDIVLITGSPATRRSFFDGEISQTNGEYLKDLRNYNKILKVRNKYLKEKKTERKEFSIYEEQFVYYGAKIIAKRLEYISKISILLNLNYRKLFDDKKELELNYSSEIELDRKMNLEEIMDSFRKRIKRRFSMEKRYGFSLCGPQKDDFIVSLNGHEAKITASQGEKKSIVFALKLSEIDMIIRDRGENPILIIDDVSSYFDKDRKRSVLEYLKRRKLQVLISSTEGLGIESKNYYVKSGDISYE